MDKCLKISASVVSHPGMGFLPNGDNFYMNGRYRHEYEMENIQVSLDGQEEEYIFAVSDSMDRVNTQKSTSISMVKDLKKFHENINGKGGDIKSKVLQLCERVEEINNIIFSMNLSGNGNENVTTERKETSFAGLFISSGVVAGITLDECRIYLLRDGILKILSGENKKTDRLLKMGIITDEQAKELSRTLLKSSEVSASGFVKFEPFEILPGDVFLLCTDGISSALDDEKIFEIASCNKDAGYIANMIVKEALKSGMKDNVTSLILKAQDPDSDKAKLKSKDDRSKFYNPKPFSNTKLTIISLIICTIIAGIILLMIFNPLKNTPANNQGVDNTNKPTSRADHNKTTPTKKPSPTPKENTSVNTTPTPTKQSGAEPNSGEQSEVKYVVKSGDSLQKISMQFYHTINRYKDIMEANNIKNENQLSLGQVLIIPK